MHKVVIVGGGAAGMIAAYASAQSGNETILLEKNEKLGKKIYITGKGRCNLTNSISANDFFNNVVTNPKFLFSAINSFTPQDTYNFFENIGLSLKIERGNRVFPASDKASDVTKSLERALLQFDVDIRLNVNVLGLSVNGGVINGVKTDKGLIQCDSVVVCTGGASYPLTGSTGDGYNFAKDVGHNVLNLLPALVGIELCGNDYLEMQGLSLKNVALTAKFNDKIVYNDFGEMLFTHFGISGPIVLSCSSKINKLNLSQVKIYIDLKPALNKETLDNRLLREFKDNNTKSIGVVLRSLLPKSLIDCVLRKAKIATNKRCSEITVSERANLVYSLKNLEFLAKKLRPLEEAIVTSGGVDVKEINPKTMESKLIKGLFFAGEVLDVDAYTGGFNLQLAFSTGYAAGTHC